MLLCGPFAKRDTNFDHDGRTYVALSIVQLLMYTAIKNTPSKPATNIDIRSTGRDLSQYI